MGPLTLPKGGHIPVRHGQLMATQNHSTNEQKIKRLQPWAEELKQVVE